MAALIAITALLGLAIGSFLNVVIYRVPEQQSLSHPGSHCMSCGHRLAWYENIPLFSWIALRGRCRSCGARISVQYPAVEALTAVFFALTAVSFGRPVVDGISSGTAGEIISALSALTAALWFVAAAVALAVIDLRTQLLPNRIIYPSILVIAALEVLSAAGSGAWGSLLTAALGLVTIGGLYLLVAFISPKGMGLGDVKYAALIGLTLGWYGWGMTMMGIILPFLIGAVVAILLMLTHRAGRKTGIPFGPSMSVGALITLLWGAPLLNWYLSIWRIA